MSQSLALAVLAGVVCGGLRLAPWLGSVELVFFMLLVPLPLMWAGLTMGLTAALLAGLTAVVLNVAFVGVLATAAFALTVVLPAVLLVRQALLSRQEAGGVVWYPPGMILAQLTMIAVGGLAVAIFALTGQPDGLLGVVEVRLTAFFEEMVAATGQPLPDPEFVALLASFLPAAMASLWLIMMVVNGILAQAIAAGMGWNQRPSPEFTTLELPSWIWPVMGLAACLALFDGATLGLLGGSALAILFVPFGFLGLAVIHKFAGRWSNRQLGLAAVYAGIVVFGWPFLLVIALGLVEDWAHLRRYL